MQALQCHTCTAIGREVDSHVKFEVFVNRCVLVYECHTGIDDTGTFHVAGKLKCGKLAIVDEHRRPEVAVESGAIAHLHAQAKHHAVASLEGFSRVVVFAFGVFAAGIQVETSHHII